MALGRSVMLGVGVVAMGYICDVQPTFKNAVYLLALGAALKLGYDKLIAPYSTPALANSGLFGGSAVNRKTATAVMPVVEKEKAAPATAEVEPAAEESSSEESAKEAAEIKRSPAKDDLNKSDSGEEESASEEEKSAEMHSAEAKLAVIEVRPVTPHTTPVKESLVNKLYDEGLVVKVGKLPAGVSPEFLQMLVQPLPTSAIVIEPAESAVPAAVPSLVEAHDEVEGMQPAVVAEAVEEVRHSPRM